MIIRREIAQMYNHNAGKHRDDGQNPNSILQKNGSD